MSSVRAVSQETEDTWRGEVPLPVIRLLDTTGDGTGTTDMTTDYSGGAEEFKFTAPTGQSYRVERLALQLYDTADEALIDLLGATSLSNGILIQVRDASAAVLLDLTPDPILHSRDMIRYNTITNNRNCLADIGTLAAYTMTMDFRKLFGFPLRLQSGEYLAVVLEDDFSPLTEMQAEASGWVEREIG